MKIVSILGSNSLSSHTLVVLHFFTALLFSSFKFRFKIYICILFGNNEKTLLLPIGLKIKKKKKDTKVHFSVHKNLSNETDENMNCF